MGQPMLFEDRKGYRIAKEMAVEALAAVDPEMAASERGVDYDPERSLFTIPFLGTYLYVAFPSGEVAMAGRERVGALAILAPHYLVYHGEPLRKEGWVAYRDMPGARQFESAFEDMAERRIAEALTANPSSLIRSAAKLGGVVSDIGDASSVLPAFPRMPVMAVLWGECEGVGCSARLLFKPSAPFYLHSEDLAVLGAVIANWLISKASASRDDG